MKLKKALFAFLLCPLMVTSCSDDDPEPPIYPVSLHFNVGAEGGSVELKDPEQSVMPWTPRLVTGIVGKDTTKLSGANSESRDTINGGWYTIINKYDDRLPNVRLRVKVDPNTSEKEREIMITFMVDFSRPVNYVTIKQAGN